MEIKNIILDALERDGQLRLKPSTDKNFLQGGICPDCHKKSVWVPLEHPWILACNHGTKCGYTENTRDRYSYLLENLTDRFKPSPENPNATADAYLRERRGFDIELLKGHYEQGQMPLPDGGYAETVRFYIPGTREFWERVIDERAVAEFKKHGKDKARIIYKFRDKCWQPPDQKYEDGDVVYITEGIFHTLGFWFAGYKAVAAFSSSNLPRDLIAEHKDKNITWRLAFDGDKAGVAANLKFAAELEKLGVRWEVALPPAHRDWDELFRDGILEEKLLTDCLYRGNLLTATSIEHKFYIYHMRYKSTNTVLEFENAWYHCETRTEDLQKKLLADGAELNSEEGKHSFYSASTCYSLGNCIAEFLYCEIEKLTDSIAYYFRVAFSNNTPDIQIAVEGGSLESNKTFKRALLKYATGATFWGNERHFQTIQERWFKRAPLRVETVPFIGYDKELKTYIFNDFAFSQGREIKINKQNYFTLGKNRFKSAFSGIHIEKVDHFDPSWFEDFCTVFGQNGVMALAFWLGSLFAEQVRAEQKSFPFLELTGEPGAGKTLLIEFLWVLVGRQDHEGVDPSTQSKVGVARNYSQVSNMPVVLIETDRNGAENGNGKRAFDFSELKPLYNGRSVRTTGVKNNGNETQELMFRGAIVIAQNAAVSAEEAVIQRIVHGHFSKLHFTPEGRKISETVFKKATTKKYAGFLPAVLKKEPEIMAQFLAKYADYEKRFTTHGFDTKELTDYRLIHNHAQIAAFTSCLQLLFPAFTDERLQKMDAFLYKRAVARQKMLVADHKYVQDFWELYDLINSDQDELDAFPNETLNHSSNTKEIAISLPHFLQEVNKKRMEAPNLDLLKNLLPSCRRHKFIGQKPVHSKIFKKSVRCWVFESKTNIKEKADD